MAKRFGMGLVLATLVSAGSAAAQTEGEFRAAVDLHPVFGLSDGIDNLGFGFDVRGGYAMALEGFTLMPEGTIGYTWFGTGIEGMSAGLFGIRGGARAIFESESVIPSMFAHLGFGSFSTTVDMGPLFGGLGGGSISGSSSTALLDFGGALDFPVADNFLVGGHAAFNVITAGGASTYLSFGAQGTYTF